MSALPKENPLSEVERLNAAADQAIEACGGDLRATIRALLLANEFLEAQISKGYMRGDALARFRMPDWWD